MKDLPTKLVGFIAVAVVVSVFLIWNGLARDDTTGKVIVASGAVGLVCTLALVAAIAVRSRKR